jgi:hypothetical protein
MHGSHPILAPNSLTIGDHPLAQGLGSDPQTMTLGQLLGSQHRAGVGPMLPHECQDSCSERLSVAVIAGPTAFAGRQPGRSVELKAR